MNFLKQFVQGSFPNLYQSLRGRFGHPAHYPRVEAAIIKKYGTQVVEGPFAGMKYVQNAVGSAYTPKILGCYEMEIHPFLERVIQHQYPVIIDIGCAEGYYAVGLAMRCPQSRVYAYDGDAHAQERCREMAKLNGVAERVIIGGLCDAKTLNDLPLENALLVCDVDGFEVELLEPTAVAGLCDMDMIVELHEPLRSGSSATVLSRFTQTHDVEIVDAVERKPGQHPLVAFLARRDQRLALTEMRPDGQQYAFFKARKKSSMA